MFCCVSSHWLNTAQLFMGFIIKKSLVYHFHGKASTILLSFVQNHTYHLCNKTFFHNLEVSKKYWRFLHLYVQFQLCFGGGNTISVVTSLSLLIFFILYLHCILKSLHLLCVFAKIAVWRFSCLILAWSIV